MKIFSKNSNYEKYYKEFVPILKKEKNQKYFTLILSVIASILFLIFAINPTLTTIANLKKQISDAIFVEERLSQKINNLSSLSQEYLEIENDIPYIIDAVPEKPQVPTLIGQIQAIGQDSSVQIFNISVLPVSLNGGPSTQSASFAFDITGNGSFANIQNFLSTLTNMQRAISVASIQISRGNGQSEALDFIIHGLAYYKR